MKQPAAIGQLRQRVIIQKTTQTIASDGQVTDSWSTYKTVDAEIVPLSGSEDYKAQGVTASVAYRITCRHVSGVTPKMRILWGARVFEIYAARNIDEQNRFLVMTCEEIDV